MLRFIGVIFLAVVAQFIIHGWRNVAGGLAQSSVDSWRENFDAAIEKDFPRE